MIQIDMEMPTECLLCPFSYNADKNWNYGIDEVISYRCMVNSKIARIHSDGKIKHGDIERYTYESYKMEDCPLMEVNNGTQT